MMMHMECMDAGMRVFALWRISPDGKCECGDPGCTVAGKHPRASNWQHTPEWSEEQLEVMEELGQFDTGYGVLVSGMLVVDVDERNGGADSYAKLLDDFPQVANAGMVVKTGSGGESKHLYFTVPDDAALVQNLPQYPGIDFKSTGYVVGPGSLHKSGNRYEVVLGSPYEVEEAPAALLDALRKPERHRAHVNGSVVDVSLEDLQDMLAAIPNTDSTDYETFIRIGMALHLIVRGDDDGYALWDEWAAKGPKYDPRDMPKKWHSFGKSANPVTFGTLAHYAEEAGWQAPVEFTSDIHFEIQESEEEGDGVPLDNVDLLRPPGFVGRLAEWINARNRHARENLATAAALGTIASVAGMRYVDPLDGITPNVFLFGVSGSATGKESILKSHQELLRAAGVSSAVHGGIKSEQEIYRNLMRHQAALYVMDELGEHLAKLQNARKRGGSTPYLEGVIGAMLSLYSKANSHALITGDMKDEIRKAVQSELSAVTKKIDNNESKDADKIRQANLMRQLNSVDNGLEAPYLCVFGLTTPERFDELMDFDMAANGFMGRSIIFRELDDNPKSKPRGKVKRGSVPDDLAATLQQLYAPGYSDVPQRVERIGDVVEIPTRPDAEEMLDRVEALFWEHAEEIKDSTGFTAIPRRGYEQVAKVSMILAIPEGLRTVEHVKWAYALIKRDVDEKIKLAMSNSAPSKVDAMASRIMSLVTTDHGESIGRIRDKCRKYRKEDVDECVKRLVEAGYLKFERHQKGRGRPAEKYFAVKH